MLALLVVRLCLAFVIKTGANQVLGHMDRYQGHIDGVGLSLWRGAYQFQGVRIETRGGEVPLPLFAARSVDVAGQWGRFVARTVAGPGDLGRAFGEFCQWPQPG